MKIRRAQRAGVTKLSGLAALSLVFIPQHHAVTPGTSVPQENGTPAASEMVRLHALIATQRHRQADAALPAYRVRAGDTLSGIAERKCDGHADEWTGIYAASRKMHLTGPDANVIRAGQELAIDCRFEAAELKYAPAPPPPPRVVEQAQGATRANVTVVYHRASSERYAPVEQARVNPGSYGGFQACVISRESGGNSQVMNASGHYGLYQFDEQTWVSGGGSAADFGHASVGEQDAVFQRVYAARGAEPWAPSDGC